MGTAIHRLLCLLVATAALLVGATAVGAHPTDVSDVDHDQFKNWADNCPKNYNPKQTDTDADTEPPVVDQGRPPEPIGGVTGEIKVYPQTPVDPNGQPLPTDQDPEKGGDACDIDDDGDLVYDKKQPGKKGPDNCRLVANPDQADADSDGTGDVCDPDDDNDEVFDERDNCPLVANVDQKDHNSDGKGNACDPSAPKSAKSTLKGGGNPNDKTAPKLRLKLPRALRFEEIRRGIPVAVTCSEGCVLEGTLTLDGRMARQLKVARKSAKTVVVGRGAAQIDDTGLTYVFVKLRSATLRRLARAQQLAPVLKITAKDANGNRRVMQKRLTLRR